MTEFELLLKIVGAELLPSEEVLEVLRGAVDRPFKDLLRERGFEWNEEEGPKSVVRTPAKSHDVAAATASPAGPGPVPPDVAAAMELPSRRLGKYVLVDKLGQGGMGEVWKGWQTDLSRYVAVKLMLQFASFDTSRFHREAQLAASLHHPNIGSIYEFGEIDGRPFLAMEYIRGRDLSKQRLPLRRALEVIRDAARAVDHAHGCGIVHRDLKPHNLMVDEGGKVYVMDFGLARPTQDAGGPRLTVTGDVLGTPAYMAPEQARGLQQLISPRTDVWSLGATLYELVTGETPFQGRTIGELLGAVIGKEPVPPRRLVPTLDRNVETVVLKCLEKDPARRYASAGDLAADVDRLLAGEPVHARRPRLMERLERMVSRHAALVTVSALALIAVMVGLASRPSHAGRIAALKAGLQAAERRGDEARVALLMAQLRELTPVAAADPMREAREARKAEELEERARDAAELTAAAEEVEARSKAQAIALLGMAVATDPRQREPRERLAALIGAGPAADRLLAPPLGEARLELAVEPSDARGMPPPIRTPGRYAFTLRREGHVPTMVAGRLGDGQLVRTRVTLPAGAERPGFLYVSDGEGGGTFLGTLVTVGDFNVWLGAQQRTPLGGDPKRPVEGVSLADAEAFAASRGGRLPTASELARLLGEAGRAEWCREGEARMYAGGQSKVAGETPAAVVFRVAIQ
jgi:predicted Ser/Thr protein kinase